MLDLMVTPAEIQPCHLISVKNPRRQGQSAVTVFNSTHGHWRSQACNALTKPADPAVGRHTLQVDAIRGSNIIAHNDGQIPVNEETLNDLAALDYSLQTLVSKHQTFRQHMLASFANTSETLTSLGALFVTLRLLWNRESAVLLLKDAAATHLVEALTHPASVCQSLAAVAMFVAVASPTARDGLMEAGAIPALADLLTTTSFSDAPSPVFLQELSHTLMSLLSWVPDSGCSTVSLQLTFPALCACKAMYHLHACKTQAVMKQPKELRITMLKDVLRAVKNPKFYDAFIECVRSYNIERELPTHVFRAFLSAVQLVASENGKYEKVLKKVCRKATPDFLSFLFDVTPEDLPGFGFDIVGILGICWATLDEACLKSHTIEDVARLLTTFLKETKEPLFYGNILKLLFLLALYDRAGVMKHVSQPEIFKIVDEAIASVDASHVGYGTRLVLMYLESVPRSEEDREELLEATRTAVSRNFVIGWAKVVKDKQFSLLLRAEVMQDWQKGEDEVCMLILLHAAETDLHYAMMNGLLQRVDAIFGSDAWEGDEDHPLLSF